MNNKWENRENVKRNIELVRSFQMTASSFIYLAT